MISKLQKISIDDEKYNAINNTNGECREQLLGNRNGPLTSQYQQPAQSLPDQEYVRMMEECYGIREEGIL